MLEAPSGHVDLEDARLLNVQRESNNLVISFEGATLVNEGTRSLRTATVRLIEVLRESVTEYGEGNIPRTVAPPDASPIDVVEVDECRGERLEIQGFKQPGKWVVWSVEARCVRVDVGSNPSFQRTALPPLN